MPPTHVALDLETTGLDSERDAIIEIGAVKCCDGEILDTFSSFVDPGRPIPQPIIELTGIRDQDVAGAPKLRDVLPKLSRFVGQHPIIGHSVGFDMAFLRQHAILRENALLDTFELSTVLFISADRYSLASLSTMLDLDLEQAHRALDDAKASYYLYRALLRRATGLPPRILKEIVGHGERAQWPAASFFREALQEAAHHPPATRPQPTHTDEPLFAQKGQPLKPKAGQKNLDVGEIASLLEKGGAFENQFPGYEHRPQQVEMLRDVAHAINQRQHLLVEAPTGVGKSLAYLIPAVYWSVQNGERVVVSTNTINLQEQLYHKDLPDVANVIPFDFSATVLKGRSHYLCPARLQALRRRGANSRAEARLLAKILVWLPDTTTGDGDRLFLPDPAERSMWRRLSAEHEGCDPERCRRFQAGGCYFYNARRAAEAAHLVIINHALLLADVAVENRALPEYNYLIVDEAHHLESATTNGLSFETDRVTMHRMLGEIGKLDDSGRLSGLLATLIGRCQKANMPPDVMQKLELLVGKVGLAVDRAQRQIGTFFDQLEAFVAEYSDGRQSRYAQRLRITSGVRVQPAWEMVEIVWDDTYIPLGAIADGLTRLANGLVELEIYDIPDNEDLQAQLASIAQRLKVVGGQIGEMISDPSSATIYWLESPPNRDRLRLRAVPLHVGPLVEEHLFHKKDSVILTSATLRTSGTFDFLRERLSAWDADELTVGSPFDYEESTLVYLVNDIPEPGQQGYQQAVAQGMAALFRATEGRALALFTSYSQLRNTLKTIRAPLAQAGITVHAQGEGASRAQLLETFRSHDKQVLLGTRSFWEGIDVPGEPLSCLAIAKLPFDVPSDPIFAARSETFEQPFVDYAVPRTILRFLQGFGRLIRTRTDRGIVAIFDKRLLTKSYGPMFLESLPNPTIQRGPATLLPKAAADWLAQ